MNNAIACLAVDRYLSRELSVECVGMCRYAWPIVMLLFLPFPAQAQGLLERIRHGSTGNSSANVYATEPNSTQPGDGLDSEGYLTLSALGVFALSSPFWVPQMIADDNYDQTGYFTHYPYARSDVGYLSLTSRDAAENTDKKYSDLDYLKPWSVQAQIENGNDFNGLNRVGARVAFDTSLRLGLRTNWNWYQESLGQGRSDSTVLGDTELTFRLAQADWMRVVVGVGFQTMEDRQTDRWGFNFTYGGELFLAKPYVVAASVDLGDLGSVFTVQARGTAGFTWRRGEVFVGYEFRRVGDVNLQGMLGGIRLWF